MKTERKWWKESVIYQVYPRSFYDSNGDGIGDLRGIIEKLDYISYLGVDVIWLSPVYKSPNDDNGYDISDHKAIMDEFGDMADMDELIEEVHRRNMRLVMDLVANHTSDEHPWFIQSRSSRHNPYRDYYVWRSGRGGNPPNNWGSFFGGSAWEYDSLTDQYYLHVFSRKQPDLNWDNQAVREEIFEIARWWLDRGVDGFRLDAINFISKVADLPDGAVRPGSRFGCSEPYIRNGPRIHEYLREMSDKVFSRYDIVTIGETSGVTPEIALAFVAEDRHELNMLLHFELMELDSQPGDKWTPRDWKLTEMKQVFLRWYEGLKDKGWNSIYLGNHDQPRPVSRFGNDEHYRAESAKLLATLLLTMPGTPFIYQGDEIGMTNVSFEDIAEYRDVETINMYHEKMREGVPKEAIMRAIHRMSRDNARTPMQWDSSQNGGFTTGTPWITVNPNFGTVNVANNLKDHRSILHYYRTLIKLRKENPVLTYGDYQPLLSEHEEFFVFLRSMDDVALLVVLNFSEDHHALELPDWLKDRKKTLVVNNYWSKSTENEWILRPYEARVYSLCAGE